MKSELTREVVKMTRAISDNGGDASDSLLIEPAKAIQQVLEKGKALLESHREWLAEFPHQQEASYRPNFKSDEPTSTYPASSLITSPPVLLARNALPADSQPSQCDCNPQINTFKSQASVDKEKTISSASNKAQSSISSAIAKQSSAQLQASSAQVQASSAEAQATSALAQMSSAQAQASAAQAAASSATASLLSVQASVAALMSSVSSSAAIAVASASSFAASASSSAAAALVSASIAGAAAVASANGLVTSAQLSASSVESLISQSASSQAISVIMSAQISASSQIASARLSASSQVMSAQVGASGAVSSANISISQAQATATFEVGQAQATVSSINVSASSQVAASQTQAITASQAAIAIVVSIVGTALILLVGYLILIRYRKKRYIEEKMEISYPKRQSFNPAPVAVTAPGSIVFAPGSDTSSMRDYRFTAPVEERSQVQAQERNLNMNFSQSPGPQTPREGRRSTWRGEDGISFGLEDVENTSYAGSEMRDREIQEEIQRMEVMEKERRAEQLRRERESGKSIGSEGSRSTSTMTRLVYDSQFPDRPPRIENQDGFLTGDMSEDEEAGNRTEKGGFRGKNNGKGEQWIGNAI